MGSELRPTRKKREQIQIGEGKFGWGWGGRLSSRGLEAWENFLHLKTSGGSPEGEGARVRLELPAGKRSHVGMKISFTCLRIYTQRCTCTCTYTHTDM